MARKSTKKASAAVNIENLSSADLMKLAKAKQQEEAKKSLEANKQKIDALKKKKGDLQKQIKGIEKQIAALTGKKARRTRKTSSAASSASGGPAGLRGTTKAVYEFIQGANGEVAVQDIVKGCKLNKKQQNSLGTTLAGLKKRGFVQNPKRGVYTA